MCFKPVTIATHPNSPQYIKDYYGKEHNVPCGRCIECRTKMINDWTFRMLKQAKNEPCCFITLTYSTSNLKFNVKDKAPTLYYEDTQLFWKRLRKKLTTKIKYFLVGEYGGKTTRPHYHAIVFGLPPTKQTIDLISNAWQLGHCHIGVVEEASIKYTLKYCLKSSFSADDVCYTVIGKKVREFDRVPEKSMISKGIGISYLQEVKNYDYLLNNADNPNIRIPRYYIKKIFNETDKEKRFKAQIEKQKLDKRTELEKYMYKQYINEIKLRYLKQEKVKFV